MRTILSLVGREVCNVKMNLKEVEFEGVDWIQLVQDRVG
jgi:hypothetical protein